MKTEKTAGQKIFWICKGMIFAWSVTGVLLLLLAFLLLKMNLGENMVNLCVQIIYVLSAFTAGIYIGHKGQNRKYLWGAMEGIIYFGILLLVTFLITGNEGIHMARIPVALGLCLAGGTVGGMLSK